MNYLKDKVILVTGGSRGIGKAIVLEAAASGASVVFCGRTLDPEILAVQEEANDSSAGHSLAVQADITKEGDVQHLFRQALKTFGRVDAAINNAAVSLENLLVSLPPEDWDQVIDTNLTGGWRIASHAVRHFLDRGAKGRIVSMGTLSQNGAPGNVSYAASKGGMAGLTRVIARQYGGRGIAANLVIAGYVETRLSSGLPEAAKKALVDACPLRRAGSTVEIARVALFLASERACGLNGQTVYASGGLTDIPL